MTHIPTPDDFPRVLTADELRFDIDFAIKQVPRSMLRSWAGSNDLKSEAARNMIVSLILARLGRYQVSAPAPVQPPFWSTGNLS